VHQGTATPSPGPDVGGGPPAASQAPQEYAAAQGFDDGSDSVFASEEDERRSRFGFPRRHEHHRRWRNEGDERDWRDERDGRDWRDERDERDGRRGRHWQHERSNVREGRRGERGGFGDTR